MRRKAKRQRNPIYPTRAEIMLAIRATHSGMRQFVGMLEAYGHEVVPPLTERDISMIADMMSDMHEDSQFVKRYLGI